MTKPKIISKNFDKFAEAVRLAPQSVNTNFLYGMYLNKDKCCAEALFVDK